MKNNELPTKKCNHWTKKIRMMENLKGDMFVAQNSTRETLKKEEGQIDLRMGYHTCPLFPGEWRVSWNCMEEVGVVRYSLWIKTMWYIHMMEYCLVLKIHSVIWFNIDIFRAHEVKASRDRWILRALPLVLVLMSSWFNLEYLGRENLDWRIDFIRGPWPCQWMIAFMINVAGSRYCGQYYIPGLVGVVNKKS